MVRSVVDVLSIFYSFSVFYSYLVVVRAGEVGASLRHDVKIMVLLTSLRLLKLDLPKGFSHSKGVRDLELLRRVLGSLLRPSECLSRCYMAVRGPC